MAKVYTYGKELVAEVENNIDEYIFFEFLVAYRKLIEQVSNVNDGMGTNPHALQKDEDNSLIEVKYRSGRVVRERS